MAGSTVVPPPSGSGTVSSNEPDLPVPSNVVTAFEEARQRVQSSGEHCDPEYTGPPHALRLELLSAADNKWATRPLSEVRITTKTAVRTAYVNQPRVYYVLALRDESGATVKFGKKDGAYMEFYQTDESEGTHLVTTLKSGGGYGSTGFHFFAAHKYLIPGLFTLRFGVAPGTSKKHGPIQRVCYHTLVTDPEADVPDLESDLSNADRKYITRLKLQEMPPLSDCQAIAAKRNLPLGVLQAYISSLLTKAAAAAQPQSRPRNRKRKLDAPKRLGDQEFLEYAQAQQKRKGKAGNAATKPRVPRKVLNKLRRHEFDPIAAGETNLLFERGALVGALGSYIAQQAGQHEDEAAVPARPVKRARSASPSE